MRFIAHTILALSLSLPLGSVARAATIAGIDGVNAIGHLPCAAQDGAILTECNFEILRKEDGAFTLRVLLPGGTVRYIYGMNGKITGTDSTGALASKRLAQKTIVHIRPAEMFEIANDLIDPK
jgi:hypothetical protein